MRPIQWHLKSNWRIPESLEKMIPLPRSLLPANRRQCSQRSTITPNKTRSADFYRCIKRRVGHSFKRADYKGNLVLSRKQAAYKLPRTQSSFSSLKKISRPLHRQDSFSSNRQHYSSVMHKQGRRYEVGPTVCPTVENLDLVLQETSDSKGPTHSRPIKCGSRQAIQTRPNHPDQMVLPSRGFSNNMQQVAPTSDRSFCHEVQQVASVSVTSTGPPGHCSGPGWPNMPQF